MESKSGSSDQYGVLIQDRDNEIAILRKKLLAKSGAKSPLSYGSVKTSRIGQKYTEVGTTYDLIDEMNGKLADAKIQIKQLKTELTAFKGIQVGQSKALK